MTRCHATTRSLFRAWNAGPEYNLARGVKQLVSKRFSVSAAPDEPLSTYAHEIHAGIDSRTIREETALDW